MQTRKLAAAIGALLFTTGLAALPGTAAANADLDRLSQDDRNWVMQAKDYSAPFQQTDPNQQPQRQGFEGRLDLIGRVSSSSARPSTCTPARRAPWARSRP
ncbi:hypothetical protein [Methylomagnum sp.]